MKVLKAHGTQAALPHWTKFRQLGDCGGHKQIQDLKMEGVHRGRSAYFIKGSGTRGCIFGHFLNALPPPWNDMGYFSRVVGGKNLATAFPRTPIVDDGAFVHKLHTPRRHRRRRRSLEPIISIQQVRCSTATSSSLNQLLMLRLLRSCRERPLGHSGRTSGAT